MKTHVARSMIWSARIGDAAAVSTGLDKGASVDFRDERGQTPLMVASSQGHIDVVRVLLSRQADVNAQDPAGRTALLKAVICRRIEIVSLLLECGADPSIADNEGSTPVSYAAKIGSISLQSLLSVESGPTGSPDVGDPNSTTGTVADPWAEPSAPSPQCIENQHLPPGSRSSSLTRTMIPIPDDQGIMGGCIIVISGGDVSEWMEPYWRKPFSGVDDLGTKLGPAMAAVPLLGTALSLGSMVQVVGSEALLSGLAAGNYGHLLSSSGAFYGAVRNPTTNQIIGQLQFREVSGASVFGPLLTWQAANIAFATMHLQTISRRLENIENKVGRLESQLSIRSLAEVMTACEILDEVCEKFACVGRFTDDMTAKLVHAETEIRQMSRESNMLLQRFRSLADEAMSQNGRTGAKASLKLLQYEGDPALQDARFLINLFREEMRAYQLSIMHEMQTAPENLENTLKRVRIKVRKHRDHIDSLSVFSELADHAESCVSEINRFSKRLFDRGLVNDVSAETERLKQHLKDLEPKPEDLAENPVYVIRQLDNRIEARRIEVPSETEPNSAF